MIEKMVVILCVLSILSFVFPTLETKIHCIKLKKALNLCGVNGEILTCQTGIHFNRYVLKLDGRLSYLEFHKLSKALCRYSSLDCVAHKKENEYIIDVNKSHRKLQSLDKLCSQTNYYNIFDFKGGKLLINIFNHIMLINVQKEFFINSLHKYTTSCVVREDLSIEDVVFLIQSRKHKYFRDNRYIENTNLDNIFVVFDKCEHEDIDFVLKYGKEVGVYAILIANQKMINKYGSKIDYVFYHSAVLEIYDIRSVAPVLPVCFSEYTSDVYLFNRTFGSRVCII